MAPVATPTTTTHPDSSVTPDGASGPLSPADGFDELFVRPVDARVDTAWLPALPDGWRHAALVRSVARQPRERRETILAGAFALVASLWAPLGVFALLTGRTLPFLVVSLAVVVVAVAPRPIRASQVLGAVKDRAALALERVRAVAAEIPVVVRAGLEALRGDDHSTPSSTR